MTKSIASNNAVPQGPYERAYGAHPADCLTPDALVIGAGGVGLPSAGYLLDLGLRANRPLSVVVVDAGPLDLLCHVGNTGFDRYPALLDRVERVGGKSVLWGLSTPRPPEPLLRQWPYPLGDLEARFAAVSREMGIDETIPQSGGRLEDYVSGRLRNALPDRPIRRAPLAINREGYRWSALDGLLESVRKGLKLVHHFRCTGMERSGESIIGVRGEWLDGQTWEIRPGAVAVAVGVEPALALLRQATDQSIVLQTADHIRIDLQCSLAADQFPIGDPERAGICVLLMECASRAHKVPYHLEIKLGHRALWPRYIPGGDNLRGRAADSSLWLQVQAIAAMHDRLPPMDLLNVGSIPPVMSRRDAAFHGEIVEVMTAVAASLGVAEPTFAFRPLLTNHHQYGSFRVGEAVDTGFRLIGTDNLFILPPAGYVDSDDDANPLLKSRVLAQYAMDAIADRFHKTAPSTVRGQTNSAYVG
jgi:hypothetical protein